MDKDSGRSKKKESKKKKKDDKSRRGHSKHCKSRGRSKSTERQLKNKCKHCKEKQPYAGKHEADKCFYNKKYKGWRPSKICKELGVAFKRRHKLSSGMGRFAADSAPEDSGSGSDDSNSLATSDK